MDEWRAMSSRGHELGNHTLFHPCNGEKFDWVKEEYDLNRYTSEQLLAELNTANSLLKAVDGEELRSFAYTCTDHAINGVSFIESIRELFPAAGGGYLNVSAEAHDQLLSYLDQNKGRVWTDTFLNVMEHVELTRSERK